MWRHHTRPLYFRKNIVPPHPHGSSSLINYSSYSSSSCSSSCSLSEPDSSLSDSDSPTPSFHSCLARASNTAACAAALAGIFSPSSLLPLSSPLLLLLLPLPAPPPSFWFWFWFWFWPPRPFGFGLLAPSLPPLFSSSPSSSLLFLLFLLSSLPPLPPLFSSSPSSSLSYSFASRSLALQGTTRASPVRPAAAPNDLGVLGLFWAR